MPNIKSAEKRMRQNVRRRLRNRQNRSRMRTAVKRYRRLLSEEKFDEAQAILPDVYAVIDRSAQLGVIHRNTASRYKSRLTRRLNLKSAAP